MSTSLNQPGLGREMLNKFFLMQCGLMRDQAHRGHAYGYFGAKGQNLRSVQLSQCARQGVNQGDAQPLCGQMHGHHAGFDRNIAGERYVRHPVRLGNQRRNKVILAQSDDVAGSKVPDRDGFFGFRKIADVDTEQKNACSRSVVANAACATGSYTNPISTCPARSASTRES